MNLLSEFLCRVSCRREELDGDHLEAIAGENSGNGFGNRRLFSHAEDLMKVSG